MFLLPLTRRHTSAAATTMAMASASRCFWRRAKSRWHGILSPPNNESLSQHQSEIMAKVETVDDAKRCRDIVDRLFQLDRPIGVDMEGLSLRNIGLVQVKAADGPIYLFRTALNKALLAEGGLGRLLEAPHITKVMHACSIDVLAANAAGTRLWGLYDTALAKRVIDHQCRGASLITANMIGFNPLCKEYGFRSNPLKAPMKDMWKYEHRLATDSDVRFDLAYYAACDVEPLLELYEVTRKLIDPDFWPAFKDLCDSELLRPLDPHLVKLKMKVRDQVEKDSLFMSGLDAGVSKPDLYGLLAKLSIGGCKTVRLSETHRTAHLVLADRSSVVAAHQQLSQTGLPPEFGPDAQLRLVVPLDDQPIVLQEAPPGQPVTSEDGDNYVSDCARSAELVDQLIRARCPLVCEFGHKVGWQYVTIDALVPGGKSVRFLATPDTVGNGRLGELLASSEVPKIVPRVDGGNVNPCLRMCSAAGFRPRNFFDLSLAVKMTYFLRFGQSVFMSPAPGMKDVLRAYKLTMYQGGDSRRESLLRLYLHLRRVLPPELLDFLARKSQIYLDTGAGVEPAKAKEAKRHLRQRFETMAVHVECVSGQADNLEAVLRAHLEDNGWACRGLFTCGGKYAFVEMAQQSDVARVVRHLQARTVSGLVLTASDIGLKKIAPEAIAEARVGVDLDKVKEASEKHLTDLRATGFFETLAKLQDLPVREGEASGGEDEERMRAKLEQEGGKKSSA